MHTQYQPHERRAGLPCDRCQSAILNIAAAAQFRLHDSDAPIDARLCAHCTRRLINTVRVFLSDGRRRV
jgi:hypothetical protein